MYYLFIELLQLGGSALLLYLSKNNFKKNIFLIVIALGLLFFFIIDIPRTYKFISQSFFFENNKISDIRFTPKKYWSSSKTIKGTISLTNEEDINILKEEFIKLKSTTLKWPESEISFLIEFNDSTHHNSFSYLIDFTYNNGVLIYIYYDNQRMGPYRNDKLKEILNNIPKVAEILK